MIDNEVNHWTRKNYTRAVQFIEESARPSIYRQRLLSLAQILGRETAARKPGIFYKH